MLQFKLLTKLHTHQLHINQIYLFMTIKIFYPHRLIGVVLVSESKVSRLYEVEVLEYVVKQVLSGGLVIPDLLDDLLFVEE
jgi:hypothetical protein